MILNGPKAQDFTLEETPSGVLAICAHCSERVERPRPGQARRAIWEHLKHHQHQVPRLARRRKSRRRRFADDSTDGEER